jgi:hypothetical protein
VIEAQCASILVPHDHLHINHDSAFLRKRHWASGQELAAWRIRPIGGMIGKLVEFHRWLARRYQRSHWRCPHRGVLSASRVQGATGR